MLRFPESYDEYPYVVADLGKGWRVIECADDTQWILQRKTTNRGRTQWDSHSFCRTKSALLQCLRVEPSPTIEALPDRYPDRHRQPSVVSMDELAGDVVVDIGVPIESSHQPQPNAQSNAAQAFDHIRGDRVLSDWVPTGDGKGMEDIPDFLLRK